MTMEEKTGARGQTVNLQDSSYGRDGPNVVEYKAAFANATVSGNTAVVAAVAGKKIRVLGYSLNNGGAFVITVNFQSGTTAISSNKDLAADGGGSNLQAAQGFLFETAVGQALNINLDAAGTVGVDVNYVET